MISTLINQRQIDALQLELGELLQVTRFEPSAAARELSDSIQGILREIRSLSTFDFAGPGSSRAGLRDAKLKVRFAKRKWKRFQTAERRSLRPFGESETHVATNAA